MKIRIELDIVDEHFNAWKEEYHQHGKLLDIYASLGGAKHSVRNEKTVKAAFKEEIKGAVYMHFLDKYGHYPKPSNIKSEG